MKRQKVSIKELSEQSGFSAATISNVLNGKKGVNIETASKILKIAKEMGYLDANKIDAIRLVIYKKHGKVISETPFFSELIEGMEKECRAHSINMTISNLSKEDFDFERNLATILEDYSTAIILLATELQEEDVEVFNKAAAPVIILDSWFDKYEFNSVIINNTDSIKRMISYLAENGHKEIGYLKSSIMIRNFKHRYYGYERGMKEHGLAINPRYCTALNPTLEGAYKDMQLYLQENPELPTAYVADNDIIALGAIKALREKGYSIPEDVSIVGFDNLTYCEISSPPLTTIHVYKQEMGRTAVRRLMEIISIGDKVPQKIEICTSFKERESVKRMINNK